MSQSIGAHLWIILYNTLLYINTINSMFTNKKLQILFYSNNIVGLLRYPALT